MNIGISTASFFTNENTEDALVQIKNLGANVCEIFLSAFSEYTKAFGDVLVQKKCVDVHSIHSLTMQFEPELFKGSERAMQDAIAMYKGILDIGQKVGAKYYTMHGPAQLKKITYNFDYQYLGQRVEFLNSIANDYGIELTYENVHWSFFAFPNFFTELKKCSPNIGACLDIKQAMQAGYTYKDYLPIVADRLKTVHLCDYDSERRLMLPGKGIVDFTELFSMLKDNGYDDVCLMEVYPQNYKNYPELKNAYEYVCECAYKAR